MPMYSHTNIKEIPILVEKARKAYQARNINDIEWRRDQLYALHEYLQKEKTGLANAVYKDYQRPLPETELTEIATVKSAICDAILHLDEWTKPEKVKSPIAFLLDTFLTYKVPYGTVLIISPWNYPISLSLAPLVAAIAGGNSAVLKFSEVTPHTSAYLADTLPRYLDKNAFQFINGEVAETTELLEQRFDMIFYTGNTLVGRIIHKAANKNLTPVILELGGKSPVIVDENVDIKVAAKRIIWGKCINSGQTCVAPDYGIF
jgi:aldehyde dehydrogenase (NAD+)